MKLTQLTLKIYVHPSEEEHAKEELYEFSDDMYSTTYWGVIEIAGVHVKDPNVLSAFDAFDDDPEDLTDER